MDNRKMVLADHNIKLRQFEEKDAQSVAFLCNNKKIWDNVRDYFPHPYTEKNAEEFIRACRDEDPQVTFAIQYKGDLAGCIGLVKQTDVYKLSAEVGYWIGEPFWGRGIATRAVMLIADYGFHTLGLIRIHTGVFDFNKASQRVLEKAGFKLEGIFEKSVVKNGKILNEYRYGKINDRME
jgi:ribosomal-protein-alanine N-acetyltransferase